MVTQMAFPRLLLISSLIFAAFIDRNVVADYLSDEITHPCFPYDIIPENYYYVWLRLHVNNDDNNNRNNNNKYNASDCRASFHSHIETQRINGDVTFDGKAFILINITRPMRNMTLRLRQSQINLLTIKLKSVSNKKYEIQPEKYLYDDDAETCNLYYKNELEEGHYILNANFEGTMGRDLEGISTISYMSKGMKKWVIISEFQTLLNQLIFPCLDQSKLNVNFNISLKRNDTKHNNNGYTIISNIDEKTHTVQNGMELWQYNIPPMSNYFLLATLNDFIYIHYEEELFLWCRERIYSQVGLFMWELVEKIPKKLEENWYIIEDEKNKKKTHFIIPGYRENDLKTRGLFLYSEIDVTYFHLFDHSTKEIQIVQSITRKLLQQYFGDQSSCLLDGLITLLEANTIEEFLPESEMMDLIVVQKQHESLHLDYYFNGETLENKCSKSTRTNSSPYYNKAPFFLRMLQYLITHDVFREGVHKYIKRHASDSTTVPNNLWAAMQDALRENSQNEYKENIHNLTYLMSGWMKQKHYPVVTIKRHVDDTVSMQLESYIPTDMRDTLMIPVTFTSQSHPNFNHTSYKNVKWLSSVLHNWPIVKFPLYFEENGWIIANLKQANYYRVNYDSENWDKIANYLNSSNYTEIHVLNRAQIIDDSFHFAIQGLQDYSLFWKISSYLSRETDYIAWYPMFKALEYISSIFPFENEKRVQDIKDFLNNIFDGLFTKIEYLSNDTDNEFTKYLKQEATRWACTLNHNECLIQAYDKMQQYVDKSQTYMSPWEREWTFCQGFKSVDIYTLKQASHRMLHDFGGQAMMFMSCVRKIPIDIEFFEIVNLLRYDRAKMTDKIFLFYSVLVKHARDPKTLDFMLSKFYNIKPSQISTEAALIVIINNIYSNEESRKVISFLIQDDNINRCLKNIIRFKIILRASQIKTQKNYLLRLKFAENIIYNNIPHNNKT